MFDFSLPDFNVKETIAKADVVAALKSKARTWAALVVKLYNTPVPAAYAKDKAALLSTAKTVKTALEKIFGKMPELQQQGLGFLPLIVVGVVAVGAAATAITKWTYDYNTLTKKLGSLNTMVSTGVPVDKATGLVNDLFQVAKENSPIGTAIKTTPFLIAGAIVAIYYLKSNK